MSTLPPVVRTTRHTTILIVKFDLAREEIEAGFNTGASALVVGKNLVYKLGKLERESKVEVRQGERSLLLGNLVIITMFKVMDASLV